jgi:hypothetical protein
VKRRTGFAGLRSATPINALQPAFMACTASSLINDCGHLTTVTTRNSHVR